VDEETAVARQDLVFAAGLRSIKTVSMGFKAAGHAPCALTRESRGLISVKYCN
jgi:hypothetical protein